MSKKDAGDKGNGDGNGDGDGDGDGNERKEKGKGRKKKREDGERRANEVREDSASILHCSPSEEQEEKEGGEKEGGREVRRARK